MWLSCLCVCSCNSCRLQLDRCEFQMDGCNGSSYRVVCETGVEDGLLVNFEVRMRVRVLILVRYGYISIAKLEKNRIWVRLGYVPKKYIFIILVINYMLLLNNKLQKIINGLSN